MLLYVLRACPEELVGLDRGPGLAPGLGKLLDEEFADDRRILPLCCCCWDVWAACWTFPPARCRNSDVEPPPAVDIVLFIVVVDVCCLLSFY